MTSGLHAALAVAGIRTGNALVDTFCHFEADFDIGPLWSILERRRPLLLRKSKAALG